MTLHDHSEVKIGSAKKGQPDSHADVTGASDALDSGPAPPWVDLDVDAATHSSLYPEAHQRLLNTRSAAGSPACFIPKLTHYHTHSSTTSSLNTGSMACLSFPSVVPHSNSSRNSDSFHFHHKAPVRNNLLLSSSSIAPPPPPPPPSHPRKNPYRVVKELGSGLQGRVVLAFDQEERKHVAVKIPSAFSGPADSDSEFDARLLDYQVQSILLERRAQRLVNHENVLKYLRLVPGKKRDVQYAAMVMEYAPNGDFFDIIADTGALSESVAKFYFQQLLSGIQACHAAGVIHRDIKPENLLLDEDFTLKICDFGLAHVAGSRPYRNAGKAMLRDVSGTALYMAPEVQNRKPFKATPVDVWSAGVVLFILLTSFPPFQNAKKGDSWYDCIVSGRMNVFWGAQRECAESMSSDARDLISGLLCANPEKRLTVAEALEHPWLRDAHLVDRQQLVNEMSERREYSLSCPKTEE